MQRQLPTINIAGRHYTIDLSSRELSAKDDPSARIRLYDLDYSIGAERYRAFYHVPSHSVLDVDPASVSEVPEGVVQIEIPCDVELDPVAVAMEYGTDKGEFLKRFPVQKNLEAKIIPFERTNLPILIKRNRREEGKFKKHSPGIPLKRKPGKGL